MNQKKNNANGHGFFRKSKAYGLVCGIALAGMLAVGAAVSADEVAQPQAQSVTQTQPPTEQVATQTIEEPATEELTTTISKATETVKADVKQEESQAVASQEEAQKDYTKQAEEMTAAVEEKAKEISTYEEEKAKVEAENKAIEEANAKKKADYDAETKTYHANKKAVEAENEQIRASNAQKKADYEAKLAEAKANKDKDGYLKKEVTQSLVYTSEPDATHTAVKSDGTVLATDSKAPTLTVLKKGETVTVTYNNLKHASYAGKKIIKAVYTYTAKDTQNSLNIDNNPAVTVTISSDPTLDTVTGKKVENPAIQSARVGMSIQLFDEAGKAIEYTADNPALLAFNSLNRTAAYTGVGKGETIDNLSKNIEVALINGSSIVYKDGVLYAEGFNDYKVNGSKFDANPATDPDNYWDGDKQVNRYYGAAVGIVKSGDIISFDIVNDVTPDARLGGYGKYWFAFNSNVATTAIVKPTYETEKTLPPAPVEPSYDKMKDLPKAPDKLVLSYHLNEYKQPLSTVKDVVKDGVSIHNGTLKIGDKGTYTLEGAKVLANGKDKLVKYDVEDKLDVEHDKYLGYRVYAFTPIKLTDGTVIKNMEDLKAFAKQTYDAATGRFYVSLNSDFLAKVAKDSNFQAKVEIDFERIKAGDVTNVFNNHLAFEDREGKVTEVPVPSNKVVTHTPEAPTPVIPQPTTPVAPAFVLPHTGEASSSVGLIAGMLLFATSMFGLAKVKKEEK